MKLLIFLEKVSLAIITKHLTPNDAFTQVAGLFLFIRNKVEQKKVYSYTNLASQKSHYRSILFKQKHMQPNLRVWASTFAVILCLFTSSFVFGQPTVTSDQEDYAPRSTAIFTGSGFTAFETVLLKVKNLTQPCNTVAPDSSYLPWSVVADGNGAFVSSWTVCDCMGDSLRLKAEGETSGLIAYAYFTDANLNSVTVGAASQTVNYGTSAAVTYTVAVRATGSGSGPSNVSLSATGLPAGVAVQWTTSSPNFASPNTINFTGPTTIDVTLTLTVPNSTDIPATPSFTVTATAGATTRSGNGNLTINKKAVTPVITASDKEYNGNASATILTRDLTGVLFNDNVSLSGGSATFANKNVGTDKTVTATGLSLAGTKANNYILTSSTATTLADITALLLTGTVTIDNKVYDGTASATINDRTLAGVIGNEKVTYTGGTATFNDPEGNAGVDKPVTATGLSLGGADAGNYTVNSTANALASITGKMVTVSYTADNKVYDGTTTATVLASSAVGVIAPDVVTVTGGTANFSNADAGTNKTVNANNFSLSGAGADNYLLNATTSFSTTANITPKELTISITADNKVYDGGTDAVIASRQLNGVLVVDAAKVASSGGTASFDNKNVGTGKTVTATAFNLTGSAKNNYEINPNTASAPANITPRPLIVTATGINKEYDGNANANATLSDDRISGDVFTNSYSSASFNNKNAGTSKPVSVSGISISGPDADNYSFNSTATTEADITAKGLLISATGITKEYDGNANATVTLSDDRISGDVFTNSYSSASFNNKNAGTSKPVSVSGISISGPDAGNYSYNTAATTAADITAKALLISATGITKEYDGNANATATLSDDRVSGDAFTNSYSSASFNRSEE